MDLEDDEAVVTPTTGLHPTASPTDYNELSNAEIVKHICLLQLLLQKRSGKEFDVTVRTHWIGSFLSGQ